jgi:hypothetical protein
MSALSSILSGSAIKGGVSSLALVAIDKWNHPDADPQSFTGMKRFLFQFLSSTYQNTIMSFLRPLLPGAFQISSIWLSLLATGATFAIIEVIVDGQSSMEFIKMNFLESAGAELIATVGAPTIQALVSGSSTSSQSSVPSFSSISLF